MIWKIYDKTGKTVRCEVHQLEYNGEFMGACSVTCTVKSPVPIDFAIGDYLEYRGERFEINYDPSILKKSRKSSIGDAFVYDGVKFNSLADELTRCNFLDYVLNDNQIHFTALPKFSFYASSVRDLADRLQANLDRVYSGAKKWTVNIHPEYSGKANVNIEVNNISVWDALTLAYEKFGATFIIKGRTITIGTTGITTDHLFQYGKGKGLYEIERNADADQLVVTRLRAYGSTRNMPNRYYNKMVDMSGLPLIPDNMAVYNLMLPDFPKVTQDPYIDSKNLEELGVREHTVFFDGSGDEEEIYPSMSGMTAARLQAAGITVELDPGDNGNLDEVATAEQMTDNGIKPEQGEIPATFTITLKDIGFDINKQLTPQTACISMKDGMCGGRDFEIVKCEKVGNKYVLTCNRVDDTSVGRVFPYKDYNIKSGDKFVLLYIDMPEVYIQAAAQRLKEAAIAWLAKNDFVRYSYTPKVDDVFMAYQHDECVKQGKASLHDTIKEGGLMLFEDTDLGVNGAVIIDTLSIKEGESSIPKYSVVLKDEKSVGTIQKIQQTIESIQSVGQGGGYNLEQILSILKSHGRKMFLRKDAPDQTTYLLKLLGGVLVDGGIALLHKGAQFGETFAGGLTGHGGKIDEKGYGELRGLRLWESLDVPELRYNQVKVFVGVDWQCAGAGIVESVVPDMGALGNPLSTGTAKLKLEKGQYGAIAVDDIVMGIFHMDDSRDATADSDDSKGNFKFAGFATVYFRITEVSGTDNGTFKYSLRPGFSVHPQPQMHFACYGNFTNTERQTSTYRTRTYTRRLWKQNTWEIGKDNIAAQDGDLTNLSLHGMQMQGYSAYLNNIYFSGTIQSLKKPDGSTIKIKEFVGSWVLGTKYQYYQEVTHNGSSWLCANEKGTSTEPSADNPDWLCTSSKGADGEGITNFGPWRSGVTIPKLAVVTMGGKSFLSKKATTNPPIWIYTDASGNRYTYSDGGYVLTGECNTDDYSLLTQDGENGAPGADGKPGTNGADGVNGTSIVWKGSFDKHPNNPQNGWAYKNSADKKSYVYQDGQWYQMTIDGADGQNGAPGKDGIGITWKGDMVSAPANPQKNWVYRDTDNGRVYIYNGTAWELMVVDGSDGIEGAPGNDGSSVFITYHDSVTAPQTPTGNGTTGGWHHNATTSVRWMSQKVAASVSEGVWGGPIEIKGEQGLQGIPGKDGADGAPGPQGEKGEKGDGYTHLGKWVNGMLVPRMGVVRMGGTSYVAKSDTYNPPCEVYRDVNNNCYTYSDGGYVLTGRINTSEYDILAEGGADGAPGADGKPGADGAPGKQGIQGCIIRDSEWSSAGVQYRNDEALTSGTRFIDVALVSTDSNEVGWICYKCKRTHTSNSSNKPGTTGGGAYWELMSNVGPIFTSLLIAKNAKIKFLQGNQLLIQKQDGSVTAGLSGSDAGGKVRFWAGSDTPDSAPFKVDEFGNLFANKAKISGTITSKLVYCKMSTFTSNPFNLNPTVHGSTFYAFDGFAGTVNLPDPKAWDGLVLKFFLGLESRSVAETKFITSIGVFKGVYPAANTIVVSKGTTVEMIAVGGNWLIERK